MRIESQRLTNDREKGQSFKLNYESHEKECLG